MRDEFTPATTAPDALAVLRPFVTSDNEVLRSAALRAMAAICPDMTTVKDVLQGALMDQDPDVRADAMETFAPLAGPQDAPVLLRSLEGDPVREVKLAAIAGLARATDPASVARLRALVASRCGDEVAWEDELTDWEDWLDVQIGAIEALAAMGHSEAIEDILAARDDEEAQALDQPVFDALSAMGPEGVAWLLAVVSTESGLSSNRAAKVRSKVAPRALAAHRDVLLEHTSAALRVLGVTLLSSQSLDVARLAREDAAPEVRLAALTHGACAHPDLAFECLQDPVAAVKAAALQRLPVPQDADLRQTLGENITAWIQTAPQVVASVGLARLVDFAPKAAPQVLRDVAFAAQSTLESRVVAVRCLAACGARVPTADFTHLLSDSAQQVRVAALTALKARAQAKDADAIAAFEAAINATLLSAEEAIRQATEESTSADLAAPKSDDPSNRRIHITPDGDIVEREDAAIAGASTLASILDPEGPQPEAAEMAEDTPEEAPAKRAKRRPVEGPDEIAVALQTEALRLCPMPLKSPLLEAVLGVALEDGAPARVLAWKALASGVCASASVHTFAGKALADAHPEVRAAAFAVLEYGAHDPAHLEAALSDPDALIRAEAVRNMGDPSACLAYVTDASSAVRRVAVERIAAVRDAPDLVADAVAQIAVSPCADSLAGLVDRCAHGAAQALIFLHGSARTSHEIKIVLDGLAQSRPSSARPLAH